MATMSDSERRREERIALRARSVISTGTGEERLEAFTRDISSGGAYFRTRKPLPPGVPVKISVFLLVAALESLLGHPGGVKVTTDGLVVRSTRGGMAVAFNGPYMMEPVPS